MLDLKFVLDLIKVLFLAYNNNRSLFDTTR